MKLSSIIPGTIDELIVFVVSQMRFGTRMGPTCRGVKRC